MAIKFLRIDIACLGLTTATNKPTQQAQKWMLKVWKTKTNIIHRCLAKEIEQQISWIIVYIYTYKYHISKDQLLWDIHPVASPPAPPMTFRGYGPLQGTVLNRAEGHHMAWGDWVTTRHLHLRKAWRHWLFHGHGGRELNQLEGITWQLQSKPVSTCEEFDITL